jgi:hypothetical protein
MKKLCFLFGILLTICSLSKGQSPIGPPPGNQAPDVFIPVATLNTDLVYKVSGRDGRLYQAYLGSKLGSTDYLKQVRDAGHLAYATYGTGNLFEPAIRMMQTLL